MKPITPKQAGLKKTSSIPHAVIQATNELIAEKIGMDGEATVLQKHIVSRAIKINPELTSNKIYDNGWMDIEPVFRKAGWKVEYDKPGFNEDYDAKFTFRGRNKKG